ncbi:DNA ligase D [Pseudoduganella aquatica]|uniref:DNA ligase (ATP) n=1 Tax=Pseudoduganella aquatica TaxID=2660641 RepID=A0A7X4HEF8_9BURK|nr:DNA ligase D [Pseudoduganella aquatica]MYN09263.1 DNA ligase D [Pseudoduganella aquatica]
MSDSLKTYKAKRNFDVTPEPAEGGEEGGENLSFVIQKHWASRLHYDFRLELDGAMKSWAVPKGPSYDTHDKRMAVHVEDHPISYNSFEGTIPEKQYGAGKVIIWDKGTWHPLVDPHKGYKAGSLKFELRGHKMHGRWALVRMKGRGEKQEAWLLIKEKDEYARPAAEFSVVDEMPDSVKKLGMPKAASQRSASAKPAAKAADAAEAAPARELPATLSPELATLVDKPPSSPQDWLFEIKFDGYRILARVDGKDVQLFTRNGNDWTHKLKPLQAALLKMKLPSGWYDGEIVVHDETGRPDFGLLQQSFDNEKTEDIVYFVFDAPYLDGHDLRSVPLEQRRALLSAVMTKHGTDTVRLSAQIDALPEEMVAAACKMGLEGIIGKRRDSAYTSRRSGDWIKLKCGQRQEFVIGGYTDPQGSRTGIGSLLLGTHGKDGKLHYAGNVGSGFNQASLAALRASLEKLAVDENPFASTRAIAKKAHWVKPTLVAEVSFGEWTRSGSVRHAVFQGLRKDKLPRMIMREQPAHLEDLAHAEPGKPARKTARNRVGASAKASAKPREADAATPALHGTLPDTLKVTNPDRVIDAESGTTKIALVRYYALVGELMMEHLKERPVSLVRAPAGVGGELFFQKHADVAKMPGLKHLDQALDPDHPPMLAVGSVEGLLSAAQWNVVEIHTQNAVARSYEKPNRMIFDLDPGKGVEWPAIQEAAELVHAFLAELGLPAFLKTSGGKGLHVVVPIKPAYGWDTVKAFSQAIVEHVAGALPDRFSFKSGPKNRVGKIYIDYLRNGRGATTVCAWSARTRPGLGISVPVRWDELPKLKGGDHWTVATVHQRLDEGNAPWDDYASSAKSITAAMKQFGFKPED